MQKISELNEFKGVAARQCEAKLFRKIRKFDIVKIDFLNPFFFISLERV